MDTLNKHPTKKKYGSIENIDQKTKVRENDDEKNLKALIDFSSLLREKPFLEQQIKEVFGHYLSNDFSLLDTRECFNSLSFLLPSNIIYLILLSCLKNSQEFINNIEKKANQDSIDLVPAITFLRLITALYGNKIESSNSMNRHDWKWMVSNLYMDANNNFSLEMDITKFNNENMFIKMDLLSMFNFLGKIISQMCKLPRDAFINNIQKENMDVLIKFYNEYLYNNSDDE